MTTLSIALACYKYQFQQNPGIYYTYVVWSKNKALRSSGFVKQVLDMQRWHSVNLYMYVTNVANG